MTQAPSDALLHAIDQFVLTLERAGHEEEYIIDAMLEYIEITEELQHV